MKANDTFDNKLFEILRICGPQILRQRQRLIAAIADTATGFQNEKRFITKVVDDQYLAICCQAENDVTSIKPIINEASQYLQREIMISKDWADYISEQIVTGIWKYFEYERLDIVF